MYSDHAISVCRPGTKVLSCSRITCFADLFGIALNVCLVLAAAAVIASAQSAEIREFPTLVDEATGAPDISSKKAKIDLSKQSLSLSNSTAFNGIESPGGGNCSPVTIPIGGSFPGAISTTDCFSDNGRFFDKYRFTATAGVPIRVDMRSTEFLTLLNLVDPNGVLVDADVGSGEEPLDSRMVYLPQISGTYEIRATAYFLGVTSGQYQIFLNNNANCAAIPINVGDTKRSELRDCFGLSGIYQQFFFTGVPGQSVTIVMQSSDLDSYVFFGTSTGVLLAENDDGGGGLDSKITYPITSPGIYVVQATSFLRNESGNFTVRVLPTLTNDNFANAQQIGGESGDLVGYTQDATREEQEPVYAGVPSSHSVWYRWTAPRNGRFKFTLADSDFDTTLSVFKGTGFGNLVLVAENDNLPVAVFSQVTIDAAAGEIYRISIDGRSGLASSGKYKLAYHGVDLAPGSTVSGTVKTSLGVILAGSPVTARDQGGTVVATAVADASG
ncbi:MAG: hypothetical protein ABI539_11055, partial [Acidobacteriota bacterium]